MSLMQKMNQAISKIEINNVFLKSTVLNTTTHPSLITHENTKVSITEETKWSVSEDRTLLFCYVKRQLQGLADIEDKKDVKVLDLETVHCVQYLLNEGDEKVHELFFKIFCETNAVYNSYPYYREYVQSTCMRVGMSPIVLPFLKPFTVKQIQEKYEDSYKSIEEKVENKEITAG